MPRRAPGIFAATLTLMTVLAFSFPVPAEPRATGISTRVHLTVSSRKSPEPISNLQASDIEVTEAGKAVAVTDFSLVLGRPQISVLIDASGSMHGSKRLAAQVSAFADNQSAADIRIVMFGSRPIVLRDFPGLPKAAPSPEPPTSSRTALYDALAESIRAMQATRSTPLAAILVITDGEDNCSKLSLEETTQLLVGSGVRVYSIRSEGDFRSGVGILNQFASRSGGRVFVRDRRILQVESFLSGILDQMKMQYVVTYSSACSDVIEAQKEVKVELAKSDRTKGYELLVGPVYRPGDRGENRE